MERGEEVVMLSVEVWRVGMTVGTEIAVEGMCLGKFPESFGCFVGNLEFVY